MHRHEIPVSRVKSRWWPNSSALQESRSLGNTLTGNRLLSGAHNTRLDVVEVTVAYSLIAFTGRGTAATFSSCRNYPSSEPPAGLWLCLTV